MGWFYVSEKDNFYVTIFLFYMLEKFNVFTLLQKTVVHDQKNLWTKTLVCINSNENIICTDEEVVKLGAMSDYNLVAHFKASSINRSRYLA